jgi:hypothetical protein
MSGQLLISNRQRSKRDFGPSEQVEIFSNPQYTPN